VKRVSRFLIAFGLMAMAIPLFIAPASAVSTTYTGLGEGLVVFGTTGPYQQAMVQNTTAGPTYCITINTPIYPGDILNESSYAQGVAAAPGGELTLEALATVNRIVRNTYPNNNASFPLAGDNNQKAASVQSAIWSFTNNWVLDPSNPQNDATVIANYNLIRGWVDGDASNGEFDTYSPSEPAASLSIDPNAASANTGEKAGPFTVKVSDGVSKVKVTVTNGVAVDSNDNPIDPNYEYSNNEGFYVTSDTAGVATASIVGQVSSDLGTVYIPEIEGHQLLMAAGNFAGESEASAQATFVDVEEETTTTTEPEVEGTIVTRPPATDDTGVSVRGTSVTSASGTLADTGVNGVSYALLAMGFSMIALGLTLTAVRKLGEIHA